jgi:hypothetical protein
MESTPSPSILQSLLAAPKDYINFMGNPKLMNLIDPHEKLLIADNIKKFTPCGWFKQNRIIAITTDNIYNIK